MNYVKKLEKFVRENKIEKKLIYLQSKHATFGEKENQLLNSIDNVLKKWHDLFRETTQESMHGTSPLFYRSNCERKNMGAVEVAHKIFIWSTH